MIPETILIIGSMKSGTTTLFDLLARHPAIAPARNKEPGFFAFEEVFALGFGWYDALFAFDPARHRYGLEGSTDYTKHPFCTGVAERLIASAPRRFRLIYLMRHPLRRIESHARHAQLTRREVGRRGPITPSTWASRRWLWPPRATPSSSSASPPSATRGGSCRW
jgi:hypothetical protein